MLTNEEKQFIIMNKDIILQIAGKYLEFYKTLIWREKDPIKKAENSSVADRIDDMMVTVKALNLKDKPENKFTGV